MSTIQFSAHLKVDFIKAVLRSRYFYIFIEFHCIYKIDDESVKKEKQKNYSFEKKFQAKMTFLECFYSIFLQNAVFAFHQKN